MVRILCSNHLNYSDIPNEYQRVSFHNAKGQTLCHKRSPIASPMLNFRQKFMIQPFCKIFALYN